MVKAASTSLQTAALSLLDSATHTVTFESTANKYTFPSPCSGLDPNDENILESASVLVAARTLSKLGRSDLAWSFLRTMFASQGTNGFLPKFIYLNETYKHGVDAMADFIGPFPGPKLFKSQKYMSDNVENIWSSNTIMATPFHATAVLEVFYLSNQTRVDVNNLIFFYERLQSWHTFLHDQVIEKCIEYDVVGHTASTETRHKYHPCLVVRHPWETEVDMQSPIWDNALNFLKDEVANKGWNPTYEVTDGVKATFDYPGDATYKSLLYLLECLSDSANNDDKGDGQEIHTSNDHIQSACPFSMIDVGLTAALAKSDIDLRQIQQILMDKNQISFGTDITDSRIHSSKQMLMALWNEDSGTFFNRIVNLERNTDGMYSTNKTAELEIATAYNFMAMWAPLSNATMIEHMVTQMLQRSGHFSFGCGEYPLWSVGGCGDSYNSAASVSPGIFPLLNYRVASGLKRNSVGLEQFIQSSTLNLICGTPNSDESDLTNCSENLLFASAFNASTHLPLGKDACRLTSTLTASIVLDLLTKEMPFHYDSEPPISSSSVIVLIAIEMVLALAIGVNCLILSLNLVRRANVDEEGDTFFNFAIDQDVGGEQELLVQSPGAEGDYNTPLTSEETYSHSGIGVLGWSSYVLSRLNPINLLREVPASNDEDINH